MILDGKSPSGLLSGKGDKRRQELKLVGPANKRKYSVIVVGTGLAGASGYLAQTRPGKVKPEHTEFGKSSVVLVVTCLTPENL